MDEGGVEVLDLPLEIAEADIWSILGSRDGPFPALAGDVAEALALARDLCTPRGLRRDLKVDRIEPSDVTFVDGPSLDGKFMAHLFEGAQEAAFLVLTVGPSLEAKVSETAADGDTVEAIILDAVGSASAMGLLTHVLGRISRETEARGWNTGACLSPGLSYWDVTGQETIFRMLPADMIGLELLESSFLKPQKSQTAVVPMGPEMKVHGDADQSFCRYCPATNCPLRREVRVIV